MEAAFGLMLMLLGLCQGVVGECDIRKMAKCYGPLGGSVLLRMEPKPVRLRIYRGIANIFEWKIDKITEESLLKNRAVFRHDDGTLNITNLGWTDAGNYSFKTHNSAGRLSWERTLQFSLQAPVTSVHLDTECLSEGQLRVSCSLVGGDSPRFSWTLDGRTLTDDKLISGNQETDNSVTLRQNVSGTVSCSVWNNVSNVTVHKNIATCGFIFINCTVFNETRVEKWVFAANNTLCIEPTTPPTTIADTTEVKLPVMAAVLTALIILLMVGGVVIYTLKKKKERDNQKEEDDGQVLTYEDVGLAQRSRVQQRVQRPEDEVEYGQIKILARPRRTVGPTADECIYANVR